MFTLHLSRFLKGPPNQALQHLNFLVHQEPYDAVSHCVYWFLILGFLAPMVAMALPFMLAYQLIRQQCLKDRLIIQPKQCLTRQGTKMELAVMVTGCDSGIGKELALCLESEGFVVFAGCLKKESFDHFNGMGSKFHPVLLDVTKDDQVQACYDAVNKWLECESKDEKRYLHALVNNAGVGVAGYVDWLGLADYELCMKVNFFGAIRMTKAFLPTFKKQAISGDHKHSQIVNVISVAGMTSGGGLAASAYEASKHATEAFTNALRLELKMFDIRVVAINPSFFDTPLTNGVQERLREQLSKKISPDLREEYGESKLLSPLHCLLTFVRDGLYSHHRSTHFSIEFIDNYVEHCDTLITAGRWNLKVLTDSIVKVIKSRDPPAQIMIGMDRYLHATFNMLPQWVRHLIVQLGMPPQIPAILTK